MEISIFFYQAHGLTPLEKSGFFNFFNLLADFAKNKNMEKFQIFDQNHGLTPLEKSRFFDFFNFLFLQSKNAFFYLSRMLSNTFCWLILPKIEKMEYYFQIFDKNHGQTP